MIEQGLKYNKSYFMFICLNMLSQRVRVITFSYKVNENYPIV